MKLSFKLTALISLFSAINAGAVVTIGHTENSSVGQFRLADGSLPTAGGVTVGFFSGVVPADSVLQALAPSTAYSSLLGLGWVDVRNLTGATAPAAGAWDFPTIGGTTSNVATGVNYPLNSQLYIVAFDAGSYVSGTQGNMASTSTSFSGSSQWAIVKDTAYKNSADPGGLALLLSSASGAAEVLVGTEGGLGDGANDIRLAAVPEPSRVLLGLIAIFGLVARRRR